MKSRDDDDDDDTIICRLSQRSLTEEGKLTRQAASNKTKGRVNAATIAQTQIMVERSGAERLDCENIVHSHREGGFLPQTYRCSKYSCIFLLEADVTAVTEVYPTQEYGKEDKQKTAFLEYLHNRFDGL
jgi:hypothetical protein